MGLSGERNRHHALLLVNNMTHTAKGRKGIIYTNPLSVCYRGPPQPNEQRGGEVEKGRTETLSIGHLNPQGSREHISN